MRRNGCKTILKFLGSENCHYLTYMTAHWKIPIYRTDFYLSWFRVHSIKKVLSQGKFVCVCVWPSCIQIIEEFEAYRNSA